MKQQRTVVDMGEQYYGGLPLRQTALGPFRTHRLRIVLETWVTLWPCPVIER